MASRNRSRAGRIATGTTVRATNAGTIGARIAVMTAPAKIGAKVREEADELARAIADEPDDRVVAECADLVYHALVALLSRGVTLADVERELARRAGVSGLDEKASRRT